ncbi:hypothetical protein [Mesorhizobium amorphae]|uniref:hypothetical protein n=1 Tax=Mesorhizobium amorphae TaxID=71433 RepID=UPI00178387C3|nr:hypothetical protein [Mesorhizobium amorphae]
MSLITALDMMEVDCDLEETADDEPSLGCLDDLELDNCDDEDGGGNGRCSAPSNAIQRHGKVHGAAAAS